MKTVRRAMEQAGTRPERDRASQSVTSCLQGAGAVIITSALPIRKLRLRKFEELISYSLLKKDSKTDGGGQSPGSYHPPPHLVLSWVFPE